MNVVEAGACFARVRSIISHSTENRYIYSRLQVDEVQRVIVKLLWGRARIARPPERTYQNEMCCIY
jgi:hypothetical protein